VGLNPKVRAKESSESSREPGDTVAGAEVKAAKVV
jgi:hypothetical protein